MRRLTNAEMRHLLALLQENEDNGTYAGNKQHYWQRHDALNRIITDDLVRVLPAPREEPMS